MAQVAAIVPEPESPIDLGFVEKTDDWLLASRFFPSKVGGKPSWLNLKELPSTSVLECKTCSLPMIFLCQLYCPIEKLATAFHRTLFVFMCKTPACHSSDKKSAPFLILRNQLGRKNEFYPYEPPMESQDWKPDLNAAKFGHLCRACGGRGEKKCSGCGKVRYCSREHQTRDWKYRHKKECKDSSFEYIFKEDDDGMTIGGLLLPLFEIMMHNEDVSSDGGSDDERERREMEKYNQLVKNGAVGTVDQTADVKDMEASAVKDDRDENFVKFQETTDKAPDQVVRYWRNGQPLWISTKNIPDQRKDIAKCELCGSRRIFEFQIMPQMLHYLKLDETTDEKESIDFGVIAVYTCEKSCSSDNSSHYKPEFVWRQNID